MTPNDMAWIRRRARRMQRAFGLIRRRAVREAARDWWQMHGRPCVLKGASA